MIGLVILLCNQKSSFQNTKLIRCTRVNVSFLTLSKPNGSDPVFSANLVHQISFYLSFTDANYLDHAEFSHTQKSMNPALVKEICGAMFCCLAVLIYLCREVSKKGCQSSCLGEK